MKKDERLRDLVDSPVLNTGVECLAKRKLYYYNPTAWSGEATEATTPLGL